MAITAPVPADQSVAAKAAQFHALIERRECSQLFVICCGQAGALMMDPIRFIREAQIIDRNVLIIRDPDQNCYQRGVSPELSDIPRLLDWLRARIAALPHVRTVYCLGSSGGAYMAMVAGHFLGAQAVWAFAPPAVVTVQGRVHSVDPRFCDLA